MDPARASGSRKEARDEADQTDADGWPVPLLVPNLAHASSRQSFGVKATTESERCSEANEREETARNLRKKARSEGFSDRASGMETKGLEPSTSALRTQGLDDFDAEKYGENDAGDSRCPNGCPSEDASAASKPALNENNIPQQLSWEQLQEQSSMPDPVAAYLQLLGDTQGHPLAQTELDPAYVLTRWPHLPQHIRQTIMTLVRSVEVPSKGNT